MTVPGLADLEIERSALASDGVPIPNVAPSELLPGVGSGVADEAVAVFVYDVPTGSVLSLLALTWNVVCSPTARCSRWQVTVPRASAQPESAETNVSPAGSESVTSRLSAMLGPLLVTRSE